VFSTYMPGYTGHIPKIARDEVINKIQHTKHIPGYGGYIASVMSENKIGESYGKTTSQSLSRSIPKGSDVPSYSRYTSTMRESFINQRNVKTMSTAELLGVSSRKDTYKKPIPIDTINKFWGVDSNKMKNDEIVQKQSYEQSYKNLWSFVDSNKLDYIEKPLEDFKKSTNSYWGINKEVQELHPDLKFKPIPGYQGVNRSIISENIFGVTYENSRKRADDLLKQINDDKAQQLFKSSGFKITEVSIYCAFDTCV